MFARRSCDLRGTTTAATAADADTATIGHAVKGHLFAIERRLQCRTHVALWLLLLLLMMTV